MPVTCAANSTLLHKGVNSYQNITSLCGFDLSDYFLGITGFYQYNRLYEPIGQCAIVISLHKLINAISETMSSWTWTWNATVMDHIHINMMGCHTLARV